MLYHGDKAERTSMQKKLSGSSRVKQKVSVVITSFDIIIRDRQFLSKLQWKFVVIDEGHRLKNLNCRYVVALTQSSPRAEAVQNWKPPNSDRYTAACTSPT